MTKARYADLIEATRQNGQVVTFAMEMELAEPHVSPDGARAILAKAKPNPHQPLAGDARAGAMARMDAIAQASHGRSKTVAEQTEFDDLVLQLEARAETAPPKNGCPSVPPVRGLVPDPVAPQARSSEAFLASYTSARAAAIAGIGATPEAAKANMRALLGSKGDAGDGTPSPQANMRRQLGQPG